MSAAGGTVTFILPGPMRPIPGPFPIPIPIPGPVRPMDTSIGRREASNIQMRASR